MTKNRKRQKTRKARIFGKNQKKREKKTKMQRNRIKA